VERATVTRAKTSSLRFQEKDLHKHLRNGDEDESEDHVEITDHSDLASRDYQLNEALNVLRGLNILAVKTEQ